MKLANTLFAQSAAKGALPILYAATSEDIDGGEYIGPGGLGNMRGYPKEQESSPESQNKDAAEALWTRSEALTETEYEL
jgi:hypothetical protein